MSRKQQITVPSGRRESEHARINRLLNQVVEIRYRRPALPKTKTYSTPRGLPKEICSLDIETWKTSFKKPEKSELAVAGVAIYRLHEEKYISRGYRAYTIDEIDHLGKFLTGFPGVIIGHNILEFDYRVLRRWIDLDGVIEKTVDTLLFLWMKKNRLAGGLGLRNLSELNLRRTKGDLGQDVGKLWKAGEREQVIQYNRKDCWVTKDLWWHLLTRRSVNLTLETHRSGPLNIKTQDLPQLLGKAPPFTYGTWLDAIETTGHVWKPGSNAAYFEVIDPDLATTDQPVFLRVGCRTCPRYFIFITRNGKRIDGSLTVMCPACRTPRLLLSGTVVQYLGDSPKFLTCHDDGVIPIDSYVEPDKARKFINSRARRYWERWMPIRKSAVSLRSGKKWMMSKIY